jgi:predicted CoA-binding protein
MATGKKTLVLGASSNPARYSYLAIKKLRRYGHPVVAIGNRADKVDDVEIMQSKEDFKEIDTVTVYLSQKNQVGYYDYLLSLKPRRIIFNPGAENEELEKLATNNNVEILEACTLVLLSTGQY